MKMKPITLKEPIMNKLLVIAALSFTCATSFAADPFTDAAQKAYAPYRAALFKTNSNSQAEAQQAMRRHSKAGFKSSASFPQRRRPPMTVMRALQPR